MDAGCANKRVCMASLPSPQLPSTFQATLPSPGTRDTRGIHSPCAHTLGHQVLYHLVDLLRLLALPPALADDHVPALTQPLVVLQALALLAHQAHLSTSACRGERACGSGEDLSVASDVAGWRWELGARRFGGEACDGVCAHANGQPSPAGAAFPATISFAHLPQPHVSSCTAGLPSPCTPIAGTLTSLACCR